MAAAWSRQVIAKRRGTGRKEGRKERRKKEGSEVEEKKPGMREEARKGEKDEVVVGV